MDSRPSKMYLLILDMMDVGHAVNTAAHAGAMIESRWPRWRPESTEYSPLEKDLVMDEWYTNSFRKVCCKVTEAEFEKAKTYFPADQWFAVTESHYGGQEVALVFKPRREWPKFFQFLTLYS